MYQIVGSSQTWLFQICTFLRRSALLRSFADLRLRSFALICALLRAFACFCERPRLERPCLGTAEILETSYTCFRLRLGLFTLGALSEVSPNQTCYPMGHSRHFGSLQIAGGVCLSWYNMVHSHSLYHRGLHLRLLGP